MDDRVCETKSTATERINLPKIAGLRFLQGALIGLGAVLPGISGGVLCVVFGVYKTVMELFSHPVRTLRKRYHILIPLILGGSFGFVVVARMLGFLLEKYPDPSVCLFVGLIAGMLPSLFREAGIKGRSKGSFISLAVCFAAILALLWSLQLIQAEIMPNFNWYLFCGFCIALSVIAPGMSFSTLLMPLGLYTPLVAGIGSLNSEILFPTGIGALLTVVLLAKAVNCLMENYYSIAFHGIIGIVMAATIVIIPFQSFAQSPAGCAVNVICLIAGITAAFALDRFNRKIGMPAV